MVTAGSSPLRLRSPRPVAASATTRPSSVAAVRPTATVTAIVTQRSARGSTGTTALVTVARRRTTVSTRNATTAASTTTAIQKFSHQ